MNTFVSRGGIKLQHAIKNFKLKRSGARADALKNFVCLDVGSSTGGFVDCLLQNGALKVYALDTAYGELAWKLRNDPRVVVMERTNILHLESLRSSVIPAKAGIHLSTESSWIPDHVRDDKVLVDLITIDAGWTKLELILPVVKKFLKPDGKIIALLKPHYEADNKDLIKGVLPKELLETVKNAVKKKIDDLGFKMLKEIPSPILGSGGNSEFLLKIVP